MQLIDPNHPFFRPTWRRWVVAILPLAWAAVELFGRGSIFWAIVFAALGAYAVWALLIKGPDAA